MDDLVLIAKGFRRLSDRDWAGRGSGEPLLAWCDRHGRVLHFEQGSKRLWLGDLEARTSTGSYTNPTCKADH